MEEMETGEFGFSPYNRPRILFHADLRCRAPRRIHGPPDPRYPGRARGGKAGFKHVQSPGSITSKTRP